MHSWLLLVRSSFVNHSQPREGANMAHQQNASLCGCRWRYFLDYAEWKLHQMIRDLNSCTLTVRGLTAVYIPLSCFFLFQITNQTSFQSNLTAYLYLTTGL